MSNITFSMVKYAVPVENVQVEAGKHAFSWAPC